MTEALLLAVCNNFLFKQGLQKMFIDRANAIYALT